MLIIGLGYGAFSITLKTDSEIHTWDGAMELLRSTGEIEDCLDTITKIFLIDNDLSTKTLTIYDANKHKKIDFSLWAKEQLAYADTEREPLTVKTCALIESTDCTAINADTNKCLNPDAYDSACTFCQSHWRANASNDDAPITLKSVR